MIVKQHLATLRHARKRDYAAHIPARDNTRGAHTSVFIELSDETDFPSPCEFYCGAHRRARRLCDTGMRMRIARLPYGQGGLRSSLRNHASAGLQPSGRHARTLSALSASSAFRF